MRRRILVILLFAVFAVFAVFAQDEIAEIADTAEILDINLDLSDVSDMSEVSEIAEIFEDEGEKSKNASWYLSFTPRVGVDNIKKEYGGFLIRRSDTLLSLVRKDAGAGSFFRHVWFQPATATGVSFCLETGVFTKLNEKSSVGVGVGYAFSQMRAVYAIENTRDSMQVLRMRSLLVNNTLSLSTNYKVAFDTSYFSIKGIDYAGFYAGGAFLLSRYFERDTISSQIEELAENRRKNYDGFGGSGRVGLFAQQKIGRNSLFEYSIGYLFSITTGYEGFWDREFYWENDKNSGKITSVSNALELSFSLIF